MARVGMVGLGNIGGALAVNLVADGHEVTVFDLDAARVAAVEGATGASSVAELAAAGQDVTLTSLPNPEIVTAVAREWAGAAPKGSLLVDLSTTLPASNQAIAEELRGLGHDFVEAPLTGGGWGARERKLMFMVGGDDGPVAKATPILESLGRATIHLGPVGTGTTMKLANSLLAFACTWVSMEALSMAVAAGIDMRTAVETIRTGGATNFFIDRGVENINTRGAPTQFSLELAAKDATLLNEITASSGIPAPIAAAVLEVLNDAVARGLGDKDWGDLVLAAEAGSGLDLTIAPPKDA
jgi:3-hydroxyisobutyrate dehydrogenase-like beta-hydroxyacid dehydrogenase